MTMDEDGLWRCKRKSIPAAELYARLAISERQKYFVSKSGKVKFKKGVTAEEKEALQHHVFNALSYDEKLNYCDRPEQIDGPSPEAWKEINAHLGTHASSLQELVKELGKRRALGTCLEWVMPFVAVAACRLKPRASAAKCTVPTSIPSLLC
jgi:putative DNA methylase